MTQYTKKDAQRETGVSRREASEAWHTARDDYEKSDGSLGDRSSDKDSKDSKDSKDDK